MKKIKRFYREHRVFTILMAVVIVCFILIGTLLFQCFYSGGSDKYGDRLEDISKYEIKKEKIEEIETKIITDDKVKTADVFRTGKIIYLVIEFEPATELMEAQNIAIKSLDEFSDGQKSYYDFNFTLKKEESDTVEGFIIEGARNSSGNGLSWNNNREVEEPAGK